MSPLLTAAVATAAAVASSTLLATTGVAATSANGGSRGCGSGAFAVPPFSSKRAASSFRCDHRRRESPRPLFAAPTDAVTPSPSSETPDRIDPSAAAPETVTAEERAALNLRERARALRREANAAEQILRDDAGRKKARRDGGADALVDQLLGLATEAGDVDGAPSSLPSARAVADALLERDESLTRLVDLVERLHERETSALAGPEGYVLRAGENVVGSSSSPTTTSFVLGDYDNNSSERKAEEAKRIGGLLDRVLEAVEIIDDHVGNLKSVRVGEEESQPSAERQRAPVLRARATELRKAREETLRRRVDGLVARSPSSAGEKDGGGGGKNGFEGFFQRSVVSSGDDSADKDDDARRKRKEQEAMMRRLIESPPWMPLSLAPFAATSPVEVSLEDWKILRAVVVGNGNNNAGEGGDWSPSKFICTSWDSNEVAASFRGRLSTVRTGSLPPRSSSAGDGNGQNSMQNRRVADGNGSGVDEAAIAAEVFADLCARVERHPRLKSRVQLFLVEDPEWRPSISSTAQEGPPPAIVALAREVVPEQEYERGTSDKALAAFSTVLTLFTTLTYALSAFALNPSFFNAVVNESDAGVLSACLPVFLGVLAISALHEAAHAVAARKYGVKLGIPVPLPSLQVGTFGSITPLRSFPSTRTAMFDVAMSGPAVSTAVSIALVIVGLSLTVGAENFADFPVIPAAFFKSSFLVGSIASAVAPKILLLPLSQPVPVHPCFFVGLSGLVASAVNLLPIGRLDGGRAALSSFGRRAASSISLLTLVALALVSLSGDSGVVIFWGALVSLTQRLPEIPAVNDVTGVGEARANGYVALLVLALLTLAPFPGGVGLI